MSQKGGLLFVGAPLAAPDELSPAKAPATTSMQINLALQAAAAIVDKHNAHKSSIPLPHPNSAFSTM